MTHNSLVVCQSKTSNALSRHESTTYSYCTCFKLYTDHLNFSRGLIFAEKLIFEGLVLFVYLLRKHNFTAWVSGIKTQTRTRFHLSNIPQSNKALHSLCCALSKLYFETKNLFCRIKFNPDMNFQRHPFDPLIMRRREIKARVIRVSY